MLSLTSRTSASPKHKWISEEIRYLVRNLDVGGRLPSERELALTYGCNFLTIRKALSPLVEDGTLVRITGSGTFVAKTDGSDSTDRVKRYRVGLLLTTENNAYARRVVQALAQAASQHNIELRSVLIRSIGQDGLPQARALRQEGCVALTVPWFPQERADELRAFARACPLPVSLPFLIPGAEEMCFEEPAVFGASIVRTVESLCRYHQQLGRTRIAFLGPDSASDPLLQRMLGAYTHYSAREQTASYCGLIDGGVAVVQRLAERWRDYRGELGVICYDDAHALRLMTAMHKIGLTCPRDYTITGINDTEASRFSDPLLSTVRQDFDYIAAWLLRSVVARIEGGSAQSKAGPPQCLIVRESCGGAGRITPEFMTRFPELKFEAQAPASSGPVDSAVSAPIGRGADEVSLS